MINLYVVAIISAQSGPAAEPHKPSGVLGDLEHPVGRQSIFGGEVTEAVILASAWNGIKAPPCHQ